MIIDFFDKPTLNNPVAIPSWEAFAIYAKYFLPFIYVIFSVIILIMIWQQKFKLADGNISQKISRGKILFLVGALAVISQNIVYIIYIIREIKRIYSAVSGGPIYSVSSFLFDASLYSIYIGIFFQVFFILSSYGLFGQVWNKKSKILLTVVLVFHTINLLLKSFMNDLTLDLSVQSIMDPIETSILFIISLMIGLLFIELKSSYGYRIRLPIVIYFLPLLVIYQLFILILDLVNMLPTNYIIFFFLGSLLGKAILQIIFYVELLLKGLRIKPDVLLIDDLKSVES